MWTPSVLVPPKVPLPKRASKMDAYMPVGGAFMAIPGLCAHVLSTFIAVFPSLLTSPMER